MPQLDYDYEEAYSYRSSGRNSRIRYSSDYNYSENVRRTSEKTRNQVFDLMNDNLARKPRYKSISEYGIPQEVRDRSFYAEEVYKRRNNDDDDLDLFFRPKVTFDYDNATKSGNLKITDSEPEEIELEEIEAEEDERKQIRRAERKRVFKVFRNTVLCIVGFAVAFLICYRYSIINEKFNLVEKSKKELLNVQTINEQMQADIESETDISYIENYAKGQLGMQKPQNSQTIYINSEKQDKIFTSIKADEDLASKSTFDEIIEKISSIF